MNHLPLFFYIKKLIGGVLMPIPLVLLGLGLSFFLFKKKPIFARFLVLFSLLFLALTSFMPVANILIQPLENRYAVFDINQHTIDVVVVLGSCHATDASLPPVGQLCSSALFRLTEGVRILNANPHAQMFLSGYKMQDEQSHAKAMQTASESLGVNSDRVRLFKHTLDTQDEAQSMAPFLQGKKVALISSASHLPRALEFFKQAGVEDIIAVPAHKFGGSGFNGISASAQAKSERAFYEYLGQAFQWLKTSLLSTD